jgi:protein-S-isoprenylcysteine O-methyltransferase Ste14
LSTFLNRFALLVLIAALVALAATRNLFSQSPLVIAAQVLALVIAISARRSFPSGSFRVDATPAAESVIRRGPYRWIRHPMYAAALLFVWAGVLSHLSALTLIIGVLVTFTVTMRIVSEEKVLQGRYTDYAGYKGSTKAVIPYVL